MSIGDPPLDRNINELANLRCTSLELFRVETGVGSQDDARRARPFDLACASRSGSAGGFVAVIPAVEPVGAQRRFG